MSKIVCVDGFAARQFDDPEYVGTKIVGCSKKEMEDRVNAALHADGSRLVDGYAPFCKHVFLKNDFTETKCAAVEISAENEVMLQTGYQARTEKELPVLVRWFPREQFTAPKAEWLDVILYSREQIIEENKQMGVEGKPEDKDVPWGIISIKGQDADHELPMQPITALRNALGIDEGGSGKPMDEKAYLESVAYWKTHAPLGEGQTQIVAPSVPSDAAVVITAENVGAIKSGYVTGKDASGMELPVLVRWFERAAAPNAAAAVSLEAALGRAEPGAAAPPRLPILAMMDSVSAGDKSADADARQKRRDAYNVSVKFWESHAPVA